MEDHEFSIFCPQTEQYKMVFKTSIFACHFFQDIFSCFHCLLKKKKKLIQQMLNILSKDH